MIIKVNNVRCNKNMIVEDRNEKNIEETEWYCENLPHSNMEDILASIQEYKDNVISFTFD